MTSLIFLQHGRRRRDFETRTIARKCTASSCVICARFTLVRASSTPETPTALTQTANDGIVVRSLVGVLSGARKPAESDE